MMCTLCFDYLTLLFGLCISYYFVLITMLQICCSVNFDYFVAGYLPCVLVVVFRVLFIVTCLDGLFILLFCLYYSDWTVL